MSQLGPLHEEPSKMNIFESNIVSHLKKNSLVLTSVKWRMAIISFIVSSIKITVLTDSHVSKKKKKDNLCYGFPCCDFNFIFCVLQNGNFHSKEASLC